MQETLKVRQANVDSLHAAHRTLERDSEALGATVPQHIADKLARVDTDWAAIQELMASARSPNYAHPPAAQQEASVQERSTEDMQGMAGIRNIKCGLVNTVIFKSKNYIQMNSDVIMHV